MVNFYSIKLAKLRNIYQLNLITFVAGPSDTQMTELDDFINVQCILHVGKRILQNSVAA